MTVEEIQQLCEDHDVAIGYLGCVVRGDWGCTIQPRAFGLSRWKTAEFFIRGRGDSLASAVEDALTKLSVFLIERSKPSGLA